MTEPLDPEALEAKWQSNERELNRIAAAPGLDRELCHAEVDRLEAEQDEIEFRLGFGNPAQLDSRRWSGLA
jgi:hypothetical protein